MDRVGLARSQPFFIREKDSNSKRKVHSPEGFRKGLTELTRKKLAELGVQDASNLQQV